MASSSYCDIAFLEAGYAKTDVEKWADRDNTRDADTIAANIQDALDQATAMIDDRLRGGVNVVPFTGTIPIYIKTLCRDMAACLLYNPRGTQDVDPDGFPVDRLAGVRKSVEKRIRMLRAGQVVLDDPNAASLHPFAVHVPSVDRNSAISEVGDDGLEQLGIHVVRNFEYFI